MNNRVIISCTSRPTLVDPEGLSSCVVLSVKNMSWVDIFRTGVTVAKELCGGMPDVQTARVYDIHGKTICSIR